MLRSSTRLSTRFSFSFFIQSWEARWWISCAAGETSPFFSFYQSWIRLASPMSQLCPIQLLRYKKICSPLNLTQFAQIEKIRGVNPVSFITLADREGQVSEFYFGSSLNSWVPPSKFNLAVSLHISTQANSAHTKCLSCTNTYNPSASNINYKLFKFSLKNYKTLSISGTRMVFQQPARWKPWFSEEEDFSQILVLSE